MDEKDTTHSGQDTAQNHSQDIQDCQGQLSSWIEKYARLQADFDNFKRRSDKERASWISSAQISVLTDLVSIVDNVDRALQEARKKVSEHQSFATWLAGFDMIEKSLYKMLAKYGVEPMTEYAHFDPEKHEAVIQIESPAHASGDILEVFQKGFMHKDTVLRPAKVSVAK